MRKILIIASSYSPISTPRAFRATELAREFARRNDLVTVYNCTEVVDYNKEEDNENIKIINIGARKLFFSEKNKYKKNQFFSNIIVILKKLAFYFTTTTWLLYLVTIIKKININEKYDLLISIGLPFTIHWGIAQKINTKRQIAKCYVADYGDPFSKNNVNIKVAPYFHFIEKNVIKKFDYITIPTEKAIESYTWLKDRKYIKVIPQGFDFDDIKLKEYIPNKIPTFAYAGIFYSDIRNPRRLFDFLVKLDYDFRFIIYTTKELQDSYLCIQPYIEILNLKLVIKSFVPRLTLIEELSQMDFIINMNNITANQVPSKLIDYALSERPIFSCTPDYIDEKKFLRFCNNDYEGKDDINIKSHDIKHIVDQFYGLLEN